MSTSSDRELPRYEIEAPEEWSPISGWRPTAPRTLLVNGALGAFVVVAAGFFPADAVTIALVAGFGGMMLGTSWERFTLVAPDSGILGALRGERREPDDGGAD